MRPTLFNNINHISVQTLLFFSKFLIVLQYYVNFSIDVLYKVIFITVVNCELTYSLTGFAKF